MTVSTRRAAQQHLKRLLRETSSWLLEGPCGGNSPPSWSFSARQVSSVSTVNELPTDPFNVSCVLPRGGLRLKFGSSETLATRMTMQQLRGAKISGSEVKVGFVIERKGFKDATYYSGSGRSTYPAFNGHMSSFTNFRAMFPAISWQPVEMVELRDVQTGIKSSARLRTSEAIEKVFVDERHYTFLYKEDGTVYLMDPTTFDQVEVPMSYFETGAVYLTDGMDVTLQYFDGKPLSASVPPRVTCTVAEAEPYFKGQTATPSYKKVILESGQQIMTPTFISAGDVIVVDTTDDSYVTRSKT